MGLESGSGGSWATALGPTSPKAGPDHVPWAGEPRASAPTWQENILQKVVMTAFADRTVVTIAVRGSLRGCKGYAQRESHPWAQEGTLEQDKARSLEGLQGPWVAGFGVGRICTRLPLRPSLSFSRLRGLPLSQGPVS